ncbi:hypothetical protein ACFQ08_08955 [Streptosporangium algeriense]|uniref:Transposase n=1 Tax=Streptosporangium algeriense TaxID=1682748 RepID=A0ABW3DLC2_9ACTN
MSLEQSENGKNATGHLGRRIDRLEREVEELREANEILQSIASFFAHRGDDVRKNPSGNAHGSTD